jgi:small subunit ribosomal protein S8
MSRTDLIGDAFTIIRNGIKVRKEEVLMPYSVLLSKVCDILKNEGYIENFAEVDLGNYKQLKVYLRYQGKKSALTEIKRVSKPGRRVYVSSNDVPSALNGYGVTLMSTSSGILTDKQAKEKGTGGEVIGMVW